MFKVYFDGAINLIHIVCPLTINSLFRKSRLCLFARLPTCLLSWTVSDYVGWPTINRKVIGGLASVGVLESAFLTYQKMRPAGLDLLCGASGGCADVLSGPYSSVLVRPKISYLCC